MSLLTVKEERCSILTEFGVAELWRLSRCRRATSSLQQICAFCARLTAAAHARAVRRRRGGNGPSSLVAASTSNKSVLALARPPILKTQSCIVAYQRRRWTCSTSRMGRRGVRAGGRLHHRCATDTDEHLGFGVAASERAGAFLDWRAARSCGSACRSRNLPLCIPAACGKDLTASQRVVHDYRRKVRTGQAPSSDLDRAADDELPRPCCGKCPCYVDAVRFFTGGHRAGGNAVVGAGTLRPPIQFELIRAVVAWRFASLRREASASAGRPLSSITSSAATVPSTTESSRCFRTIHGSGSPSASRSVRRLLDRVAESAVVIGHRLPRGRR